mmetsp:Transcript_80023/g.258735  ORF Transcript_80023/g.258735 Transcript_80023/m.258735 type:complete len:802 (+) Transcript_80023:26-2431(+)
MPFVSFQMGCLQKPTATEPDARREDSEADARRENSPIFACGDVREQLNGPCQLLEIRRGLFKPKPRHLLESMRNVHHRFQRLYPDEGFGVAECRNVFFDVDREWSDLQVNFPSLSKEHVIALHIYTLGSPKYYTALNRLFWDAENTVNIEELDVWKGFLFYVDQGLNKLSVAQAEGAPEKLFRVTWLPEGHLSSYYTPGNNVIFKAMMSASIEEQWAFYYDGAAKAMADNKVPVVLEFDAELSKLASRLYSQEGQTNVHISNFGREKEHLFRPRQRALVDSIVLQAPREPGHPPLRRILLRHKPSLKACVELLDPERTSNPKLLELAMLLALVHRHEEDTSKTICLEALLNLEACVRGCCETPRGVINLARIVTGTAFAGCVAVAACVTVLFPPVAPVTVGAASVAWVVGTLAESRMNEYLDEAARRKFRAVAEQAVAELLKSVEQEDMPDDLSISTTFPAYVEHVKTQQPDTTAGPQAFKRYAEQAIKLMVPVTMTIYGLGQIFPPTAHAQRTCQPHPELRKDPLAAALEVGNQLFQVPIPSGKQDCARHALAWLDLIRVQLSRVHILAVTGQKDGGKTTLLNEAFDCELPAGRHVGASTMLPLLIKTRNHDEDLAFYLLDVPGVQDGLEAVRDAEGLTVHIAGQLRHNFAAIVLIKSGRAIEAEVMGHVESLQCAGARVRLLVTHVDARYNELLGNADQQHYETNNEFWDTASEDVRRRLAMEIKSTDETNIQNLLGETGSFRYACFAGWASPDHDRRTGRRACLQGPPHDGARELLRSVFGILTVKDLRSWLGDWVTS